MNAHLTEAQFNDLLIEGTPAPECEAHLALCAECREQVAMFEGAVAGFSQASLKWSESRPAPRPAAPDRRQPFSAPLGWALAAVTVLLIGVPVWNHDRATPPARAIVEVATDDSDAQISQDNRLLESVNLALNTGESSPLREYNLGTSAARRPTRTP